MYGTHFNDIRMKWSGMVIMVIPATHKESVWLICRTSPGPTGSLSFFLNSHHDLFRSFTALQVLDSFYDLCPTPARHRLVIQRPQSPRLKMTLEGWDPRSDIPSNRLTDGVVLATKLAELNTILLDRSRCLHIGPVIGRAEVLRRFG